MPHETTGLKLYKGRPGLRGGQLEIGSKLIADLEQSASASRYKTPIGSLVNKDMHCKFCIGSVVVPTLAYTRQGQFIARADSIDRWIGVCRECY